MEPAMVDPFKAFPEPHAVRLREYANFYAETYGNREEVADLIPFILEAFLDRDKAFKRIKSDA